MALVGGVPANNTFGRNLPFLNNEIYSAEATVTLAQLNAGFIFLPAMPDVTLKVIDLMMIPTGTFTTATDIRISDTTGTPVDVSTLAIAQATNGNVVQPGATGLTVNAGFGVPLTANQGLQLRKTGSNAAAGTSIRVLVRYKVNN